MLLVPGLIAVAAGPLLYQLGRWTPGAGRPRRFRPRRRRRSGASAHHSRQHFPGRLDRCGGGDGRSRRTFPGRPRSRRSGLPGGSCRGPASRIGGADSAGLRRRHRGGFHAPGVADAGGVALFLHLLPVGLTVWLLLRPLYGIGWALGGSAVTAAAVAAGLSFGEASRLLQSPGWGIFQAAAAGSLLYLLFRRSQPANLLGESSTHARLGAGLGGFAGVALLAASSGYRGFRRGRLPRAGGFCLSGVAERPGPGARLCRRGPWSTPCFRLPPSTGCGGVRRCHSRPAEWVSDCRFRSAPAEWCLSIAVLS